MHDKWHLLKITRPPGKNKWHLSANKCHLLSVPPLWGGQEGLMIADKPL